MSEPMYGTDKLYRDALVKADKWHQIAIKNASLADDWYVLCQKSIHINKHLQGLAIFQGLVILGLLVLIVLYG